MDRFDDDETEIVNQPAAPAPGHLDDDQTEIVNQPAAPAPGHLDDDQTEIVNRSAAPANRYDAHVADEATHVVTTPARGEPPASPGRSLRDRVPASGEKWSPPPRPRDPGHQPGPQRQSRYRLLAALAALLIVVAVVVFIVWAPGTADPAEAPAATTPTTQADPDGG